jgi:Fe-S cluster assembly iron-binding protein IscA
MDLIFRNIDGFEYISPNVVGAEISEDIIITERAMDEITKQLNQIIADKIDGNSYFIRLFLVSTPAKAKRYSIKFDNFINEFDRSFELRKLKIVINRKDLFYFMGVLIDYINNDKEKGFIFFDITDPKVNDYYKNFIKK